jgi:hypothetical protein
MISLLETLNAFGGSSTSTDVYRWFIDQNIARAEDLADKQRSGETRFAKEVRFARQLLFYGGLVADGAGGSWRLTPLGWEIDLDVDSARALARRSNWIVQPRKTPSQPIPLPTRSPSKGPAPLGWKAIVSREVSGPASTYAMRSGNSDVWKVGFSTNLTARLAELNRHIPVELLNCRWVLALERRWPDSISAYQMEQRVLARLSDLRTTGERVQCAEKLLARAWAGG